MAAGDSAAHEGARDRAAADEQATADERARRGAVARRMAAGFRDAAHPGSRLAQSLIELEPLGWAVLADRRWPGSLTANIDLVLVGPGGVLIVDAKDWREVSVGTDSVVRGTIDVTDEIARFADLVYRVQGLLAEVGVAPGEVEGMVAFPGRAAPDARIFGLRLLGDAAAVVDIAGRGGRLDPRRVAAIRTEIERILPPAATTGPLAVVVPVHDAAPIADEAAAADVAPLAIADLERALERASGAAPVAGWMTSLHPDQARLARRSFSGPARVRGAAGTGKTAVALHRAAYLARTTAGRVLVTSSVRALPRVLYGMMRELAPDVADRVEFTSVRALARRILVERRGEQPIDPRQADDVFRELWVRLGADTPLVAIDPAHQYWLEELHHVIKGRGLVRFEEYEQLPRTGRRRPLNRDQRAAMWRLYVAYEQELRRRGILDDDDLVLEAEASLLDEPLERYDAVIVDEAQDLSCAALRMLHLLVGDRPDGLLLVADGRQSIYPGGWTLAEAGVSVAGRGAVLTVNHRTTAEIAEFAHAILRGESAPDIGGGSDDAPASSLRHGPEPVRQTFESRALHDASFIEHVRGIVAAGGRLGDIGVLALSSPVAQEAAAALEEAGIPTVDLERLDGSRADAVAVGTVKRAKGLEFTDVLVVRAPLHLVQPIVGEIDPGVIERRELQRRELYVATTRAREHVWVGVA